MSNLQPPFAQVTSTDHGGLLWIASALSFSYFVLTGLIRVFISRRSFHRDAFMLVIGTILGAAQVFAVFTQLSAGFGQTLDLLDDSQLSTIEKSGYVSDIFFILTLACAKCSVVLFVARLTPDEKSLMLGRIVLGLCAFWGFGGVLAVSLQCNLRSPWISIDEKCSGTLTRWQVITALDITTEVLLLCLPLLVVWKLQMTSYKKFVVIFGFCFRLPLIAIAALHLNAINTQLNTANQTLNQITPCIFVTVELGWGLISATIPCLRSFVDTLGTGYLGARFNETIASQAYTVDSDNYMMDTIGVSNRVRSKITAGNSRTSETASNRSLTRTSCDDRDDLVIRKTTGYNVQYT